MQFKAWYDKFSDTITITEDNDGSEILGFFFYGFLFFALLCILVVGIFFIPQILLIRFSKRKYYTEERSLFLARGNAILSACYCLIILYLYFFVPGSYSYMIMLALAATSGSVYSLFFSIYAKYKLTKAPSALSASRRHWLQNCRNAVRINVITLPVFLILFAILVVADPKFLIYF